VLGTFPKAFSQGQLPKWQFPKWQLPKCAISQAATSQMYIFPNNNFLSGDFPMKEKQHFPHERSIK